MVITDRAILDALERHGEVTAAAAALGLPRTTYRNRLSKARLAPPPPLEFPTFPSDEMPDDQLVEHMCREFERRHAAITAKQWFPVKVKMKGPIGVVWMGDPHVDDDGTNWPLLKEHARIIAETEGLFAANIGDTTNNWIGRLSQLYANQNTSRSRAVHLAELLISRMGIKWLLLLRGNHDIWSGEGKNDPLSWMQRGGAPMADWQAQFRLVFPNGREVRIWAAHDFPGHSMWNSLHGPQKAAHTKEWAHLLVCGHKHNWACHHEESASRGFVYWLARARGYKFIDDHALKMGHQPQRYGAAITSIFNPDARDETGLVTCFADVAEAANYLTYLRSRS